MATAPRTPQSATFIKALQAATTDSQYLGDIMVIDGLFRNLFNDALKRRLENVSDATAQDDKDATTLAKILLGKYEEYQGQPEWNRPGGIDEYVAEKAGIEETEPEARVATAILQKIVEFYKIVTYSQQPEVLDEQWAWQIDALVADARNLFLGIIEPS